MSRLLRSRKSLSSAEAALIILIAASVAFAQGSAPAVPADLKSHIGNLSSLDFPVRMNAARAIRRVDAAVAVGALRDAVASHPDEYVRYRAFILLSAFNERATDDVARMLLKDRNDRLREAAYKWLEAHPDPALTPTLLGALLTERAEFVRPALVGALAALGANPQVQRALTTEIGRGVDFFRGAVIDALGRHEGAYAVEAVASVANLEGPLQDDAVLALGRIGGPRARAALAEIPRAPASLAATLRAARCLAGDECESALAALVEGARAQGAIARGAFSALAALAADGQVAPTAALLGLAEQPALHDQAALALATAAVLNPPHVIGWLGRLSGAVREVALSVLKDGFDDLEEDFGKEQFFAATRASYWKAAEGSPDRAVAAAVIQRLEF